MKENLKEIITKLDLSDFIEKFNTFFARSKPIYLEGDKLNFIKFIKELDNIVFSAPPEVKNLDNQILHLKKYGILKLDEIFEFVKIILYFNYLKELKNISSDLNLYKYLENIIIPTPLLDICNIFDQNAEIKKGIYEELDSLNLALSIQKNEISKTLQEILNSNKILPYLVDRQIHYINGNETLLLKAGFNHYIKGIIISRSQNGFFYLLPNQVYNIHQRISQINDKIQDFFIKISKDISLIFQKNILFLNFINKEFDKFDHLQARVKFAKAYNLEFITQYLNNHDIILKDFSHPALENPKPISINFSSNLLMVTGVNAGGKTMLLKSILSSVFLAKYLLPMKINASSSKIPNFKNIFAIISDPQNSKNDISTFAGRMLDFSKILSLENLIIGIDEIELGTDADEAASLYKVLLENLLDKKAKIIITTHHKRLASLMANDNRIQICAAIFDENRQMPTYDFLHGSIGKSYAFETALRYNIPKNLILKAKEVYGKDKEKLNELIEKSTQLEMNLNQKTLELEEKIKKYERKKQEQEDLILELKQIYNKDKTNLENLYKEALSELKKNIKNKEISDIHRSITNANKILQSQKKQVSYIQNTSKKDFKINDKIKYKTHSGVIKSKNQDIYTIELDNGIKLKTDFSNLKHLKNYSNPPTAKFSFTPSSTLTPTLDLHGFRLEEALEKLDKFISDCLIAGFDEVLIYHGIGTGKLSLGVKNFLNSHPKILSFSDAPPQMGGYGAKIVKL